MTSSKTSIEVRLAAAQTAIESALNDNELRSALEAYGYNSQHIQQGQVLHQQAVLLYQQRQAQYGQLYAVSDGNRAARKQAYASYTQHVMLARMVFRFDRGSMQALDLAGKRETTLAGWMLQARQFYSNALASEDILAKLGEYGLTRDKLEAGQQQIVAVDANSFVQRQRKGAAQHATRQQQQALAALDAWTRNFRVVARVALVGQPELLARLGITVRTS